MDTIIQDLYTPRDLVSLVKQALAAKDIALSSLSPKSLAAVDQLHTGGLRASLQLAKGLDLTPDTHILDAGCGLGGTARILAGHCRVTGLDLTPALVEAARTFSHWCDMEDRLHFKTGSITAMPFGDKRFDKVLCQHILMNIEDKPHALLEIHRVLKPGGELILHELFQGENPDLQFPVPWADGPGISFLEPWEKMEARLTHKGFIKKKVEDTTHQGIEFWEHINKMAAKTAGAPPRSSAPVLGPHLVFGKNARHFKTTMAGNFASGALQLVEAIFTKQGEV